MNEQVPKVLVIAPVACDEHSVFLEVYETRVYGLYCEDCDAFYPAEPVE